MEPFLEKFFPDVYAHVKSKDEGNNAYCKYNNQGLQLFTSCLFIAGMVGGLIGGYTTRSAPSSPMPARDFDQHRVADIFPDCGLGSQIIEKYIAILVLSALMSMAYHACRTRRTEMHRKALHH